MERTCCDCKWYEESVFGSHCITCYGTINWEPRKVNTSNIHNYTERIKTKNDSVAAMVDGFVAYNNMGSYFLGTRPDYNRLPDIKNVIFNDPATIVFWSDGSKTVVKVQDGDEYDEEKGLAMAISKKALGNQGNYCNVFKKWLPKEDEDNSEFYFTIGKLGKVISTSLGSRGLNIEATIDEMHSVDKKEK